MKNEIRIIHKFNLLNCSICGHEFVRFHPPKKERMIALHGACRKKMTNNIAKLSNLVQSAMRNCIEL